MFRDLDDQNGMSEDYKALLNAIGPKRKRPTTKELVGRTPIAPEAPAPRLDAVKEERGEDPTAQALMAWAARVAGVPIIDVAHKLGVPLALAKKLIGEAHDAIHEDLKDQLDLNRQLDLHRIDGVIQTFYPIARSGDPESANVLLRALTQRGKLTGIEPLPDPGRSQPQNVMIWLQAQLPSINKLVDSLPLELPPRD